MKSLLVPRRFGFEAPKLAGFPSQFYRVVGGIVDKDVSVMRAPARKSGKFAGLRNRIVKWPDFVAKRINF